MPRGRPATDPLARLMAMVEKRPDGCWRWRGRLDRHDAGQFRVGKHVVSAARAAWVLLTDDPMPRNKVLYRACGHRWCVRPEHMQLMSRGQLRFQPKETRRSEKIFVEEPASACAVQKQVPA